MSRSITHTLSYLIPFSIPVLLVLTNIYFFMTPSYLDYEYGKSDFPKADLFSNADRRAYSGASIEYIRGGSSLEKFKALGVYQDREIKHMIDVRELVAKVNIFYALTATLALSALAALAAKKSTRALAARALVRGARLSVALFIAIGIFAAVAFQTFFTLFHRIFFEGDSWLFLYTDSLIQFYPLPFWFDTSLALVVLTLLQALIIGAIGWRWGRALAKGEK
ncbi:MAG: TIGR01906 family membrane protein [Chloroflexi bacterium]|nr:TIGR01906 family membrane protein [Chloroflexota bacterium]